MSATLNRSFNEIKYIMKKLAAIAAVTLIGAGCSSTLTVGPKANESSYVGADASTKGASITVPLVKAEVKATGTTQKKK
jgi:hypothetical protein